MSKQIENCDKVDKRRDPDLAAAEIAMKRAAEKARQRARQTGGGIAVWKNGRVVIEQVIN